MWRCSKRKSSSAFRRDTSGVFEGIQLLRRNVGDEIEFVTIMRFDSLDAVREFAGEDYEVAVVPDKARAVLAHFDARSQHYEIRAEVVLAHNW